MKAAVLKAAGLDNLEIVDLPEPTPGPGEVLVRINAASLNYRDLLTFQGGYGSRQKQADLIPLSDGAGEVISVGDGVSAFKPGDRVVPSFFPNWRDGPPTAEKLAGALGGQADGVLCEQRVLPADALVPTPANLTDVQAAALPCAAVTAWSAVITQGGVGPGDVVLTQGTGGVSLFALQFAKLAGASVIATSSSDEKLEKARALGADHLINYKSVPEWARAAREITGGRGVDHVVEVGGAGTLEQSIKAVRVGGAISLIGVLSGPNHTFRLPLVVTQNIRMQGVTVGSTAQLSAMLRAVGVHGVEPAVDKVYPLAEVRDAIEYMSAGRHFGKVCISL